VSENVNEMNQSELIRQTNWSALQIGQRYCVTRWFWCDLHSEENTHAHNMPACLKLNATNMPIFLANADQFRERLDLNRFKLLNWIKC